MSLAKIKQIQGILGVDADGIWGRQSQLALDRAKSESALERLKSQEGEEWRPVMASSFADPADVLAFRRCKAKGKTDQECFKVGDNGIGKWGDDTTAPRPMVALPPEDWKPLGTRARGASVEVSANGRFVTCELRDTMPAKKNIKNGAGIDLNPAACAALGLKPPVMVRAAWRWV